VVDAYHRLLNDRDPDVRRSAAAAWCLWESATPSWPPAAGPESRFENPDYAFAFARIVTHYVRNNAWLEDGVLLQAAGCLAETPGVLINGRFDLKAPIVNAWELKRAWPRAELIIVDDAGHRPTDAVASELIKATDRLVTPQ
jgi:proline iminopeptidase